MQGKGIVKFFLIVITIVCAVQYMFLLPTRGEERKAENYAQTAAAAAPEAEKHDAYKAAKAAYLDSISSEVVLHIPLLKKYTYQDLKNQQLALGLDLKGGMSVLLQVDLREFLIALSGNNEDETFIQALDQATASLKNEQSDYITLFTDSWASVANGKKLYTIFRFSETIKDRITANTSDGEMARILRDEANQTVERTFTLLKKRIDKLGVTQPNVTLDAARDLILVELPGIDNPERARTFLQAAAKLEFWDCYRIIDGRIVEGFVQANDRLSKELGTTEAKPEGETQFRIDTTYAIDSLGNIDSTQFAVDSVEVIDTKTFGQSGPLFDIFEINQSGSFGYAIMGTAEKNKRDAVMNFLMREEIRALFPPDLKFLWGRDPVKDPETRDPTNRYELYAVKMPGGKNVAPLEGDEVVNALAQPDSQTGEMQVSLRMNQTGARTWGQMTQKAAQDNNREIAIVLDNEVASAPRVINPILNGNSSISGSYTAQEAKDLASILQIGKLPARTVIIQESLVGPSLGKDNINRSVTSMVIGFLIVLAFMLLYYAGGGIVSIIALFLNIFFIFGSLASIGTVLTLPGIAGIVLTIGMAVDANVIIYERIREELRAGKSLSMSITDGFAHSYSAIIDANVTTLLTAIVLAYFGLGPIKGFAVVLFIGILSSLFTAVLVSRLVIDWWTSKGRSISFWSKLTENSLSNVNVDWMGKRKFAYMFSGTLILIGILSFAIKGFELGVDFKGGYSYNIEFAQDIEVQSVRDALTTTFGATPVVKAVDTRNTYNVVTSYNIEDSSPEAAEKVVAKLFEGIQSISADKLDFEKFQQTDAEGVTHVTSSTKVGPTVADDIKVSAFYAAIFALLLIFLYIFIRFSKWQYSAGAVGALFHDVLITLGAFSILHGVVPFSLEVDQAFIAAILTVIGYSINDTVIVFDRIREYIATYTGKSRDEVLNAAINSTLSRTMITSLTTFFVVFVLFLFGGGSIKGFSFAILVGIAIGTYSSIFVATPIMADLSKDIGTRKKSDPKKGGFSKAASKAH
ncbi:MAG: protein translocase subunit SecDF [Saprospirales bacterium]|nr:protein translocase subunit SecDF [Saprospirales bacterium]